MYTYIRYININTCTYIYTYNTKHKYICAYLFIHDIDTYIKASIVYYMYIHIYVYV